MYKYLNVFFDSIKKLNVTESGFYCFNIGVFFLLSAPSLSALLLFISVIISTLKRKENYLKDKSNYIFIISSIFLLLSVFLNNFGPFKHNLNGYDSYLSLIGLFNWIPYFYCFWAFQPYLNSDISRKKTSKYLISGSIPLLVTGIGQYWFNWNGPLKTLNGLIIWFQRPITNNHGMTGLFNNANYAGSWFLIVLPFLIALIGQKSNNKLTNFLLIIFVNIFLILIYFTKSRNALFGSILSIQLITLSKFIFLSIISFIFIIIIYYLLTKLLILDGINNQFLNFIETIHFGNFATLNFNLDNLRRFLILKDGLTFFLERPLLGSGSASFSILYFQKNGIWYGHSHNIIMEMLISYGLVFTVLMMTGIFLILYRSFRKIYLKRNKKREDITLDKAWWTSATVIIFSQLFDILFLDFRIGMIFWILLSGLSTIKYSKK